MTTLMYGALNRPRPYDDITEKDPLKVPFNKSVFWSLYRGFFDLHHEDYSTLLEPEIKEAFAEMDIRDV